MSFNASGTFTTASGSTSAVAGAVIASATWNAIFTDLAAGLTTVGAAAANTIKGNDSGSTATVEDLTIPEVHAMLQTTNVTVFASAIAFSVSSTDTTLAVVLPAGFSNYVINGIRICNAGNTLASATVSLWTGAGMTGVQVITSTAVTVVTATISVNNNAQLIQPAPLNTQATNVTTIYFRVMTGSTAVTTADVLLTYAPLY